MHETLFIGKNVIQLPSVPSTNQYLKELINQEEVLDGTLIYTTHQTQGKGQIGNVWESEKDKNLAVSFLLKPSFLTPDKNFYLNIAVSLAVREFCEAHCKEEVEIKWPNDILIKQKKVAGILIENSIQGTQIIQSIVGVGVNVNQTKFSNDLPKASSLKLLIEEDAVDFEIRKMLPVLASFLEKYYLQLRQGNFQFLTKAYKTSMWRYQQTQDFYKDGQLLRGEITGIYKDGRIEIDVNGKLQRYGMKEISFLY